MENIYLRVKGIIRSGDRYLLVKRWLDDRVPEPYVWEFADTQLNFGETPDEAVLRGIHELLSVDGRIERVVYTWSNMIGDSQCVGIAYLCSLDAGEEDNIVLSEEFIDCAWVKREEFSEYIDNPLVLGDLEGAVL